MAKGNMKPTESGWDAVVAGPQIEAHHPAAALVNRSGHFS